MLLRISALAIKELLAILQQFLDGQRNNTP